MFRLLLISTLVTASFAGVPNMHNGRIEGGTESNIKDHPYQVSYQVLELHYCGGVLVAPNMVLTTARCNSGMKGLERYMNVRAGSDRRDKYGQYIGVKKLLSHPKYNSTEPSDYDYDVSFLILRKPVNLSDTVQLISLQNIGYEVPTGQLGTISGWGFETDGGLQAQYIREAEVPKIKQSSCQNQYPDQPITDRMFCFGHEEERIDVCYGDYGGALVIDGKLAGLASWGYGCSPKKLPGVYANVGDKEIHDFITSAIAKYGRLN